MRFLLGRPAAALFMDPGLGKTACVLAAMHVLMQEREITRAVVIAPLRVMHNVWPQEVSGWSDFHGLRPVVLHGPKKAAVLKRAAADGETNIFLVNPDGLKWFSEAAPGAFGKRWPEMLVVDESTAFKNGTSKRQRLLRPMLPRFRRRVILTGTPVPNGYLDVWAQIYLLDLGLSLGRYYSHFRTQYFQPGGYGGFEWRIKPGSEETIRRRLEPIVFRASAREHLKGLPSRIDNIVRIDMPAEVRSVYRQMEKALVADLRSGTVSAVNAAGALAKCRQICNGEVYVEEGGSEHLHDAKLEACAELLDSLAGEPALVVYDFQHDLARLQRRFRAEALVGPPREDARRIEAWNRGELPVLLVHPQSAGHGLNLQHGGHHLIWFSLPWNLEHYDQTNARLHRSGQRHTTVVHHLVVEHSVDEAILATLRSKDRTQRALLDALEHTGAKAPAEEALC